MHKILQLFFLTFLAALLSACATSHEKLTPVGALSGSDGYVVARVRITHPGYVVHFNKLPGSDNAGGIYVPKEYEKGNAYERLTYFPLKAGTYHFSKVHKTLSITGLGTTSLVGQFANKERFTVAPGKINYIGDLKIDIKHSSKTELSTVSLRMDDNRDQTMNEMKFRVPWIFSKYPVN